MSGPPDGFRHEVREQLRTVGNGLIELEGDPDPDPAIVDEVFRAAHSLKGSCSMVDLEGASALAHAIEDALEAVRAGELVASERLVDDALTAVDGIDTALDAFEAGEPTPDPEPTRSRLRETIDAERVSTGSTNSEEADTDEPPDLDDLADPQPGDVASSPDELSPPDGQEDISVEEALDRASVFDDLDALTAELDEDDSFDDLDKWGTFDEASSAETDTSGADSEPTESEPSGLEPTEPTPTGPDSTGPDSADRTEPNALNPGTILFEEVKAEVETDGSVDDLEALEADIEAAEFGEFDDQDELTIEELLEADPADTVESEDQDIGAGEVADDDSDGATSFEEVAASVEPDDDLETLEADIEAEEFGEFDDEDVFTIPELVAADPEDLDEERAFDERASTTDADSDVVGNQDPDAVDLTGEYGQTAKHDPTGEDNPEPGATMSDVDSGSATVPEESGDATVPDESGDATSTAASEESADVNPFFTPDLVEEGDDTDRNGDESTDGAPGDLEAETEALLNDAAELLGTADDYEDEDSAVDAADVTSVDSTDSADGDDPSDVDDSADGGDSIETGVGDEVPTAIDPDAAGDVDVDTAMADLDELVSASGIDEEADGLDTEAETGAAFARDADVEAFEERFSGLFGDSAEDGKPAGRAATTLEASALTIESSETASTSEDADGIDQIGSVTVDVGVADALLRSVEELSRNHLRLERSFNEDDGPTTQEVLSDLRSVTAGLRETVMDVRLMPLSAVTDDLPRVLRAAARETETEAALDVSGADVTLDRGIIDRLGDPLAHLLRNAVAHGIESPAEREAVGKSREGTVTIRAQRRRDRVHIEVADDGRGLDPGRIRRTAIDQGIVTEEEAAELTLEEVYDLVFHPGFSTADEVTEVSGRGVGLDVVDRIVTELNGTVEVDSEPGEGTTVRLSLPMSVAVSEVLFVRAGDEEFAIRLSAIERVGKPDAIETVDGREMVTFDSLVDETVRVDDGASADVEQDDAPERYPLLRLSEAFETGGDGASADDGVLVQLRSDLRDLVLYCDDFGGTREVVVDPYTGVLGGVPGLSGTTTRGDGSLVNVLDVHTL